MNGTKEKNNLQEPATTGKSAFLELDRKITNNGNECLKFVVYNYLK